jgi:hypothetical protein
MLVVMRVVFRGGSALTGRIGRHSTAGLAGVAAASLVLRSLMKVLDAAIRNLVAKEAS